MRKILLILILLLVISSFGTNAQSNTAGYLSDYLGLPMKSSNETLEWGGALATTSKIAKVERYTFLVIPLNPKEAVYLITLIDWTKLPIEFQNLSEAIQGRMIPSILLTQAYEQGYRIEYATDSYVILTKPIYEKEQE